MKRSKEFVSSDRKKIEAELLRLMQNPRCYAISTIEIDQYPLARMRIIERVSDVLWLSNYSLAESKHLRPSCFSKWSRHFRVIAEKAARHSSRERTLIVWWFA